MTEFIAGRYVARHDGACALVVDATTGQSLARYFPSGRTSAETLRTAQAVARRLNEQEQAAIDHQKATHGHGERP